MRFPPPLRPGARVALIAPSGPLRHEDELERSVHNVRALGWEAVVGEHVAEHDGYLAGTDAARTADLNRFANDDSIDAVWCIRGGYGAMRLLPGLDYAAWQRRPRTLIGYSDITALHAAIGARADLVTFHGPTARTELTPFTRDAFVAAVTSRDDIVVRDGGITTLNPGRARGRLTGGNLALVASLAGTPYAPDLTDAILVLEDVSESVYRTDRMLTQLRLSGALDRVAGVVFGHFTDIPDDPTNAERPIERLLDEVAGQLGVPCVGNFPIGHIDDHVTLPLGAIAELDAGRGELVVRCKSM